MRKLLPLLACVMLVLSMWSGVVQAGENAACADSSRMQMEMTMGASCDQVPADADNGYPHHHAACHGLHLTAPDEGSEIMASALVVHAFFLGKQRALDDRDGDRSLRPPQA